MRHFFRAQAFCRFALVAAAVAFSCFAAARVDAAPTSYIYGIDDNNDLYEIDPIGQTLTKVFSAQSPVSGQSNAFAYDRSSPTREFLFFMNGGGSTSGSGQNLYVWNKLTNTQSLVANTAQLGIGSAASQPANAAFYNDAYWFFEEGTANLYKVVLDYTGGAPVISGSSFVYDMTGVSGSFPTGQNYFGDIAINTTTGMLYASNSDGVGPPGSGGYFFSVDISTGEPTTYTALGNSGFGLQLSFSEDYNTLYGQRFISGSPATGEWYTVNTADGSVTSLSWTSAVGFRDLGGASPTSAAPVPEIDPASFGSAFALLLGVLALVERRSLRRLSLAGIA